MIKKIVFLIALMLLPMLAGAQKVIQMEKEGGVYKIACKVNGARMKMIFDTGASSVSLSMSIANYLYDNDYITKEDILGKGKSQTADGSIVDHIVINLRDIEIDGLHLKNVEATVIAGQDAPLLLGQSAIQKLGSVTINGNSLVINNASSRAMSDEEAEQLRKRAFSLYEQRSYYGAIEVYSTLRKNLKLTTDDYLFLIFSYSQTDQHEKLIEIVKEWEGSPEYAITEERDKSTFFCFASDAYDKIGDYNLSVIYMEKQIASMQLCDEYISGLTYSEFADKYEKVGKDKMAMEYYIKAIRQYLSLNDNSIADIYNGKITDKHIKEEIGFCLTSYAMLYNKLHIRATPEEVYLWLGAAKCGDEIAIEKFKGIADYTKYGYSSQFDYLFIAR